MFKLMLNYCYAKNVRLIFMSLGLLILYQRYFASKYICLSLLLSSLFNRKGQDLDLINFGQIFLFDVLR